MTEAEKKVAGFINRHILVFGFVAVSVFAFMIRNSFFPQRSLDWQLYLAKWIEELASHPGLSGIGKNIGEYNVPYMLFLNIAARTPFNDLYEVKLFSIVFDYLLAGAAALLVYRNTGAKGTAMCLAAYAAVLMTPVSFIDSAWWSQCDSIYSFGVVLSLYYLVKEKYGWSWFWFGIAFSFKLQAIFFLPVLLIYYLASKKMSIFNSLIAAAVFCVMLIPALIAGRGLKDTFGIYVSQAGLYNSLTLNTPNIHCIIEGDTISMFQPAAIFLTAGVLAAAGCVFIKRGFHSAYAYITLAFWTVTVCVFLLPSMHERYTYLSCIMAIIWAAVGRKRYDLIIAVTVNAVSIRSWMAYMFHKEINFTVLAFVNLAVIVIVTARLFSLREEPAAETAESENEKKETPEIETVVDTAKEKTEKTKNKKAATAKA